jgi:hypothetical protein
MSDQNQRRICNLCDKYCFSVQTNNAYSFPAMGYKKDVSLWVMRRKFTNSTSQLKEISHTADPADGRRRAIIQPLASVKILKNPEGCYLRKNYEN